MITIGDIEREPERIAKLSPAQAAAKPTRGMGRIYKRDRLYWMAYSHQGQEFRESTKTEDEQLARDRLAERVAELRGAASCTPDGWSATSSPFRKEIRAEAAKILEVERITAARALARVATARAKLCEMFNRGSIDQPGVYFIKCEQFVKIGFATDFTTRLSELQVGNPFILKPLYFVPGPRELEKQYHALFVGQQHGVGEWFRLEGALAEFLGSLKKDKLASADSLLKAYGRRVKSRRGDLLPVKCLAADCAKVIPASAYWCLGHQSSASSLGDSAPAVLCEGRADV